MSIQIIDDGETEYTEWTCDNCGFSVLLHGTDGDVAECPRCIANDEERDEDALDKDISDEQYVQEKEVTK